MSLPILLDLAAAAALAVFALLGARRGIVLSLCGLAAVFLAWAGAGFASHSLAPRAAQLLEPRLAAVIEARLDARLRAQTDDPLQSAAPSLTPSSEASPAPEEEAFSPEQVLAALRSLRIPEGAVRAVEHAAENSVLLALRTASREAAASLAESAASAIIFAAAFALILAVWGLVSRGLNLVARLPGLRFLNRSGGALLGLLKGGFVLFAVFSLTRALLSFPPEDAVARTHLARLFLLQ